MESKKKAIASWRHRDTETQTRTVASKAKAAGGADVAVYITSTDSQTLVLVPTDSNLMKPMLIVLLTDGAEIVIETGTGY